MKTLATNPSPSLSPAPLAPNRAPPPPLLSSRRPRRSVLHSPPPPASTAPRRPLASTFASIWNTGGRMRPPRHAHLSLQTKSGGDGGKPWRGRRACGGIEVDDGGSN